MTTGTGGGGLVGLFARHRTAGNLLMIAMLLVGLVALAKLKRQFFPDFGIDVVTVSVSWPGATAQDVEGTIIQAIEPEVRFLANVKRVNATAQEGMAIVSVEMESDSDMQEALSDVEQAVAQITTLPEDSERPVVRRVVRYDTISRLVVSGPYDEATLKAHAKSMREELLRTGIDKVTLFGARDENITVEIAPATLRQLDLTPSTVAGIIRQSSQDVPAGDVEGPVELQPRALGQAESARDVAAIPVLAEPDGRRLLIGGIATIEDGFDSDAPEGRRFGERAIELHVQRSLSSDALEVAAKLDGFLESYGERYPADLVVERYDIMSDLIEDRIRLLLENGASGLVLVLGVLFLFLNARVAFWVAMGIPVSLAAMLAVLWLFGMSINMISLFAMLLAIGIVVDDAIVVGEHATSLRESGMAPDAAAELGAIRMMAPVTSATLTTIAAFLPLMVIGDIIGTIIREIPVVVIFVLLASLIECLLVLPTHMRVALSHQQVKESGFRKRFNDGFARFRDGFFRRLLEGAIAWRYVTLSVAIGALVLALGLMASGRVPFVFFDGPESDRIEANVAMAPGTSRARTTEALALVERALLDAANDLSEMGEGLVIMSLARVGEAVSDVPGMPRSTGSNIGGLEVELAPSDRRDVRTPELIDAWRERLPPIAGLDTLTVKERRGGPPGRELDIRLRGDIEVARLKEAAIELRSVLERLPGVSQLDDDLAYGKQEVLIELLPRGEAMGFTTESVGRQLRDAFEGAIARRFARGDEEVEIKVRFDAGARADPTLGRFLLRSPSGEEVALGEVASLRDERGFARIQRRDGSREVAITGELDEALIRLEQVQETIGDELAEIAGRYGLESYYAGRAEEQMNTLADIRLGAIVGLVLIYIILAWVFGSFSRPVAVMLVIPFGLVGAVLGHLVMGFNMSILSLVTLLGLSGILVNDSIILVSTIDEKLAEGGDPFSAIVDGTLSRFRAVLLTSLTTIGGLAPLLFETSFQALFLQPMAVTLCFGLAVTTFLVLLLVPSLVAVQLDFGRLYHRLRGRRDTAPALSSV
ncbi:MAG: efflux RND transporter permease subunit [Geminicoccaceae bacterium]